MGLEERDDLRETVVAHVLKPTEHTGPEEDLRVAETIVVGVELERGQHLLRRHLAVDEALGDGIGSEDGVPEGNELAECRDFVGRRVDSLVSIRTSRCDG